MVITLILMPSKLVDIADKFIDEFLLCNFIEITFSMGDLWEFPAFLQNTFSEKHQ